MQDGNVLEWAEDCSHKNYTGAPADGRTWTQPSCPARVLRGRPRRANLGLERLYQLRYAASLYQGAISIHRS